MINVILTQCTSTSNFQTLTHTDTQYSDHNALYYHYSLIFNSRQVLLENFACKLTFLITSVRPTLYVTRL